MNSAGQQILSGSITAAESAFDVSTLAKGLYFLKISDNYPATKILVR
jgi:hypothetical protein